MMTCALTPDAARARSRHGRRYWRSVVRWVGLVGREGSASLTHVSGRPSFVLENVTGPRKVWPVDERKLAS